MVVLNVVFVLEVLVLLLDKNPLDCLCHSLKLNRYA